MTKVMFGDRSYAITAPRLWNILPEGIRDSISLAIFNTPLCSYLCIGRRCKPKLVRLPYYLNHIES